MQPSKAERPLLGLKENVIIGKGPSGTGSRYNSIKVVEKVT